MATEHELLRIFVGESDRYEGVLLYEAIIELAKKVGLNGATVLRGIAGFQAEHEIHRSSILRLSEDLPIVIEIVDSAERIAAFVPKLDGMIEEGLVTVEQVRVLVNRRKPQ